MISTKFAPAAALFSLLSTALALPQSIQKRSFSPWCDPGSPYNFDAAWIGDQSALCQEGGIATHCCATFVGGGGSCDAKWDSQSVSDLENVLAQQIKKTGQWSSTTVGKWYATYELLADDKVNPNVLSEWFHSISTFAGSTEAQEGIGGVDWIFFNYVADHTLSTIMVSYQC